MKRSLMAICAAALAAPLAFSAAPAAAQGFSLEIGPDGPRFGLYNEGPRVYYNGFRGYRDRRAGYRYHGGYWFPHEAFMDHRHTGSIYDYDRRREYRREYRRDYGRAHVEWCYDRYRSYRASDNTFQPYSGSRQQCYSPYS
jgi:hypothetical protein